MKKWIKGYEGHYMACSDGYIYSYKWGKERRLTSNRLSSGYCTVCLVLEGIKTTYKVHRLVAKTLLEPPEDPSFTEVDHINRIPWDNRLENIRWANRQLQAQNRRYPTKVNYGEILEGTLEHPEFGLVDYYNGFCSKYGVKSGDIRRVLRGERKSCSGWKLV